MEQPKKRGRKPIKDRTLVKSVRMDFVFSEDDLAKFGATRENKDPLYKAIYTAVRNKKNPKAKE